MSFQSSTSFSMGDALNKLRQIENTGTMAEDSTHADPGMEPGSVKQIDDANYTRLLARMHNLKSAVPEQRYLSLRSGIRNLYNNQRPSLSQMSALMALLETILGYVADDHSLFQRLKSDLARDAQSAATATTDSEDSTEDDSGLTLDDTEFEEPPVEQDDEDDIFTDEPRELKS